MKFKIDYLLILFVSIAFVSSYAAFSFVCNHCYTDMVMHVRVVIDMLEGNTDVPANVGFYALTALISGFSTKNEVVFNATLLVLAAANAFRFWVYYQIINEFLTDLGIFISKMSQKIGILCTSLSFLFIFSLPNAHFYSSGFYYLGQTPPNIWHNSTIVLVFPFAILLFWNSYKLLIGKAVNLNYLFLLIFLNIIIKPSFFFVFAAIFPFFLLFKFKISHLFFNQIWPLFLGMICLGIQSFLIYKLNFGSIENAKSGIAFSPFKTWNLFLPSCFFASTIISSLFFPIVFFVFNLKIIKNKLFLYSLCLLLAAFAIFICLIETGPRETHGNFFWQMPIVVNIMFLISSLYFLKNIFQLKTTIWSVIFNSILLIVYISHIISQYFYFMNIYKIKSFL